MPLTHRINGSVEQRNAGSEMSGVLVLSSLIRRRYHWLAAGLIFGLMCATAYCLLATPTYESSTQILVVKKQPTLPARSSEGQREFEQAVGEDLLATHMLILKSPRVVEDAVHRNQLDQRSSIRASLGEDEDLVDYVIENLRVARGGEGQGRLAHVITLKFRHDSAQDCADVLQAVVDAYRHFLDTDLSGPVDDALNLIRQAKDDVQRELHSTRQEYQRFRESAPLFWKGNERWNVHQARQESFERALAEVRLQMIDARARLDTLEALEGSGEKLFDVIAEADGFSSATGRDESSRVDAPNSLLVGSRQPGQIETARAEFQQLLALKLEKRELLGDFGADHPRVLSAQESIDELEAFLRQKRQEFVLGYKQMLESYFQELTQRAGRIEQMLQAEEDAAKTLVQAELKDEVLRNELERNQRLFDSVVARLDEINLARDYGGFATDTIAPVKHGEKVSPLPLLALPVGLFVGLALGLFAAVLADLASLPAFAAECDFGRSAVQTSTRKWNWTPHPECDDVLAATQGESSCPQ